MKLATSSSIPSPFSARHRPAHVGGVALPCAAGSPLGVLEWPAWTAAAGSDCGLAVGAVLTVGGLLLHVRLGRQRMSAEEGMKDGRLTEAQATLMIRLCSCAAPTLTLLGAMVLVIGFAEHLR